MKKMTRLLSHTLIILSSVNVIGMGLQGCASTPHSESSGQYIDNSALTLKVKAKLLADKSMKSFPITVNTYKNTVQLSGFVDTQYQKQKAALIAYSVQGVQSVQNDLIIKSKN